jgi:hypothetical protein
MAAVVEQSLGKIDKELSSGLSKKQEEFDHWHTKIRESAKARQIEQKQLDEMKRKARKRVELDRQIRNLERSSEELVTSLKDAHGQELDLSKPVLIGDADGACEINIDRFDTLFPDNFNASEGFSEQQRAFLDLLPSAKILKSRLKCYQEHNADIRAEVERLKSKNVVLGENYQRMVIACTGWTAEQVDEAAEGLTECMKDLNENPLAEDVAIEILMKDRGQDW